MNMIINSHTLEDFINTIHLQSEIGQIIRPLHYAGIVNDVKLPDPSNYKHGDVIINLNGIYVNQHINNIFCWIRLNCPEPAHVLNIDETEQKEFDPTPWLALLE